MFINYTTKDGLPDDVVTQVVEGNDGKIYVGTNFGIAVIAVSNSPTGGNPPPLSPSGGGHGGGWGRLHIRQQLL